MRVFCPEHKRGFFAPRQSPVRCENRNHILGEMDFLGETKIPIQIHWQYCCNCEHFCPIDLDQDSLQRCPVCTRRCSTLYLCDRCYTISFESDTPLQTKNFTLRSDGTPKPSCPGCLQESTADLREHTCEELRASFVTALNTCPICEERLDVGPAFPCSVAYYLKKTKSANKINVTFDYETGLFIPVEDGEFVVISDGDQSLQPIVLPRAARFSTKRDFYEFYQDYYHCAQPEAGEVQIIQPATVARVVAGWKLQGTGVLEVLHEQPEKKKPLALTQHSSEPIVASEGSAAQQTREESPVTACAGCGSLIETRYAFCWKCGEPLKATSELAANRRTPPLVTMSRSSIEEEEDEQTVQHEPRPAGPQLFSWATPERPQRSTAAKGAILKLMTIALVGLLLGSIGFFVFSRLGSRTASVSASESVINNGQSKADIPPVEQTRGEVAAESIPQQTSTVSPEDDALKKLHDRGLASTDSERPIIIQAYSRTEKQFPSDYRFPYERAKLTIDSSQKTSHDEAFKALAIAAVKAINAGKSSEMLDSLEADKAGDFHKLAHGHREWSQLLEALKSNDARVLKASMSF